MIKLRSCIGAVVFASCIGSVAAQVTWSLTGGTFNSAAATNYTVGTVSGVSLGLTAYANTRGDDSVTNDLQTVEQQIGADQGTGLAARRIGINDYASVGGGVGIVNRDGCGFTTTTQTATVVTQGCDTSEGLVPEDALDNNQRYEMILLSFGGAKVSLTALNLGYVNTGSDMTIMAYTGGGNALTDLQSGLKTWSDFGAGGTSATTAGTLGWKALANFNGGTDPAGNRTIVSNGIASSYWLIGAYNPLANPNGGSLTLANDYMKVSSVSGIVPEPGTLALLTAALLGMAAIRQRKSA